MFAVYILYSKSFNRYYVGYTNNLERRISEHNRKKGKFTDAGIPWELVYYENFKTKKEAMDRERCIKRMKSKNLVSNLRGKSAPSFYSEAANTTILHEWYEVYSSGLSEQHYQARFQSQ